MLYHGPMRAAVRPLTANRTGLGTRKAMLETLVRQLNMVRLSVGALALVSMVGCTGLIDGGSNDESAVAKKAWLSKAAPVLMQNCVACHDGSRAMIEFLAGEGDLAIRDTVLAFTPSVINLDAPASSRLLTKGVHDGPALLASQQSDLLEWIQAEKDAQPDPGAGGPTLETAQFTPAICTSGTPPAATCPTNEVDLTDLGLPGAKIHFVAQALGSGLYLNQLSIIAGADGVYMEHPLFASWPTDGSETRFDTIDRFYNIKMNTMANATESIGGGTAAFIGFTATDKISIHFKAMKAYQPDAGGGGGGGGGATGGCKVLASFKANAQAMFTTAVGGAAQSCLSCHGGQNASATSAMAITGVNAADDPTILAACNQIKTRIDTTTPASSGVILAPDPANNNHPFRFTAAQLNTFKNGPAGTGLLGWINAEKVAP